MVKLKDQLAALSKMQRQELQMEWVRVYRQPTPKLSADLLRLGIAYRLQEKACGGLSRASLAELNETSTGRPTIKPGTRLVRSWNGRTISVEVIEDGFVCEDRHYPSLSAIAREVTGSHWSGPRFFGLRGQVANG
ncbi:DUF2924 domain-containing protein [Sphingopyxis sp. XHP0097]|uniref:DUF2924 domain-containing protein n=1 Tax=Sphingopyxis jiangsuensis TaxID=2871171 RepID=A0ABS7MH78_9SPHN|nr:DUF2924 domain-containing protein [Sphingopyxis jiangsuensis]MBY4638366.1 DUF2924 domain-containing protein [Sphingopyxis jiangsuensis]